MVAMRRMLMSTECSSRSMRAAHSASARCRAAIVAWEAGTRRGRRFLAIGPRPDSSSTGQRATLGGFGRKHPSFAPRLPGHQPAVSTLAALKLVQIINGPFDFHDVERLTLRAGRMLRVREQWHWRQPQKAQMRLLPGWQERQESTTTVADRAGLYEQDSNRCATSGNAFAQPIESSTLRRNETAPRVLAKSFALSFYWRAMRVEGELNGSGSAQ